MDRARSIAATLNRRLTIWWTLVFWLSAALAIHLDTHVAGFVMQLFVALTVLCVIGRSCSHQPMSKEWGLSL